MLDDAPHSFTLVERQQVGVGAVDGALVVLAVEFEAVVELVGPEAIGAGANADCLQGIALNQEPID